MNEEERMKFCAEIMSAARKCRIGISKYENNRFTWIDPVVGITISGQPNEDKEKALESACHALVDYLQKPHP